MSRTISYYFTVVSPWAYIGHDLITRIARKNDAAIDYRPVNLGEVFPQSGGLPLAKRHPLRVAYRTVELKRWREKRGLNFALKPKGWPFNPELADCVALALLARGEDPNVYLSNAFRAVFEKEINLGESANIASVLSEAGHDAATLIADAQSQPIRETYAANNKAALDSGVFGSPSYLLDGEVFWGQDRIELLDEALASGRPPFLPD